DVIVVVPPSTSNSPADAPAAAPAPGSALPLTAGPGCVAPPLLVAARAPRSQRLVVAVSLVLLTHPLSVSKSSENSVVCGAPQVCPITRYTQSAKSSSISTAARLRVTS